MAAPVSLESRNTGGIPRSSDSGWEEGRSRPWKRPGTGTISKPSDGPDGIDKAIASGHAQEKKIQPSQEKCKRKIAMTIRKIVPGETRVGWIGTGVMGSQHVRPPDRQGIRRYRLQPHPEQGRAAAGQRSRLGRQPQGRGRTERRGLHHRRFPARRARSDSGRRRRAGRIRGGQHPGRHDAPASRRWRSRSPNRRRPKASTASTRRSPAATWGHAKRGCRS